jgi:hypothetical protein
MNVQSQIDKTNPLVNPSNLISLSSVQTFPIKSSFKLHPAPSQIPSLLPHHRMNSSPTNYRGFTIDQIFHIPKTLSHHILHSFSIIHRYNFRMHSSRFSRESAETSKLNLLKIIRNSAINKRNIYLRTEVFFCSSTEKKEGEEIFSRVEGEI